jgi:hypothetical protein
LSHTWTGQPHDGNYKPSLTDLIIDPQTTITLHLLFTYIFSILALYMLHRNFHRFLRARQMASLERSDTTPAKTVIIQNLPTHLREVSALKDYLERQCDWAVDDLSIVKRLGSTYKKALAERNRALTKLEEAHWQYGGSWENLDGVTGDAERTTSNGDIEVTESPAPLVSAALESPNLQDSDEFAAHWSDVLPGPSGNATPPSRKSTRQSSRLPLNGVVSPHRPCTHVANSFWSHIFPWLGERVDAIDYWTHRFREADAHLARLRLVEQPSASNGRTQDPDVNESGAADRALTSRMTATGDAFVTFKTTYDAVSGMSSTKGTSKAKLMFPFCPASK